jgi:hypothetical protein
MTGKPFSGAQYDADDDAKNQVGKFIAQNWGLTNVRVNPNRYGIDLLADDDGTLTGIEVEVKHNWTDERFPFSTVHFSARKTKFLDECPQTYFAMLNHDRTSMIVLDGTQFDNAKLVCKHTRHTTNEWFLQLPLQLFRHYVLT